MALVPLALTLCERSAHAEGPDAVAVPLTDPMLAAAPAARIRLETWGDTLEILRSRSTELHLAQDDMRAAQARAGVALAQLLPNLTGSFAATHQFLTRDSARIVGLKSIDPPVPVLQPYTAPPPDSWQGGVQLVQPLFDLGAFQAYRAARADVEVSRTTIEDTRRILIQSVARIIVAVVTAERVAELNRSGLARALDRVRLTGARLNLGGATRLDVTRVDQDVDDARATLVKGDEALRQMRESLGLALGISEQVGVAPTLKLDALEAGTERNCRALEHVDERADVAAAHQRVEVAERRVKSAYGDFLPVLSAQSTLSSTSIDTGTTPQTLWSIQALLTVPLWDSGVHAGALHQAQAEEDRSRELLERQKRSARIEIDQARRAVLVAEESRAIALHASELAKETERLTELGYQNGQGTSLELVVAAAARRDAETTLALRQFDEVSARIASFMALARCDF